MEFVEDWHVEKTTVRETSYIVLYVFKALFGCFQNADILTDLKLRGF